MRDSTTRATVEKPERPEGFRLFAHAACVWAKKVRGKLHYFGPWSDPDGSLNKSLDEKDDLLAGRNPRRRDGLNVGDLCNRFLSAKRALVDAAEMTSRHWGDYYGTCESVVDADATAQSKTCARRTSKSFAKRYPCGMGLFASATRFSACARS
jgi:hypothetical protein